MPHIPEFGKNFLYSHPLDLLIQWGEIHLLRQDKDICQLEQEWESAPDRIALLYSGLKRLEEKVEQALSRLRSTAALELNPDQTGAIKYDLKILDQVIFLIESIEFFPDAPFFPEDFQNRAESLLHQILIEDWIRLIPLNSWRREILKKIPSQSHYLFPWYKEWSDAPDDVFDTLATHWDDFIHGKMNTDLPEKTSLNLLANTLLHYRELLNQIHQDAHLFQLASQAIKEDSELSKECQISSLAYSPECQTCSLAYLAYLIKTAFQPLSFKFVAAAAMLFLAISLSIYNYHDASRIVYHAPQKKEVVRKKIDNQSVIPEKPETPSEPIHETEQFHSIFSVELKPPEEETVTKPMFDPFRPLIRQDKLLKKQYAALPENAEEKPGLLRDIKEAIRQQETMLLENIDISQLKLVAIIRSENGNKALLQDVSGKGYIVTKGTYIGVNGVIVAEILKEKIIVEDKTEDQSGRVIFHTREIMLPKE